MAEKSQVRNFLYSLVDKIGTVCSFHYKLSLYITEQNNTHFLIMVSGLNQLHKVKQIVGLSTADSAMFNPHFNPISWVD